ncbi:MAG TPA: hypothetical protein VNT58_09975 [Gaiellaceae bacterium]|nr:hypothetical protein [Gaiellaceae bacterium]
MDEDRDEARDDAAELERLEGEELPARAAMSVLPVADPIGGFYTLPVEPPDQV